MKSWRTITSEKSRQKRLAEMKADPNDRKHGTYTGYTYGCRCDRCVEVGRSKSRAFNARRRAKQTAQQKTREWQKNRVANGHASYCPGCGKFTTRASGFCCKCDPAPKETRKERTVRYLAELLANPKDPRHGTTTGYTYGCRCVACATAAREQRKKRAAKKAEKKGPHPWSRRLR